MNITPKQREWNESSEIMGESGGYNPSIWAEQLQVKSSFWYGSPIVIFTSVWFSFPLTKVKVVSAMVFINSFLMPTFTLSDACQRVQTRGLLCLSHSLGMDFQVKGFHDFQDGIESRGSLTGEGFV